MEINKKKEEKENIEKKYKVMIKNIKSKEKGIKKENKDLKKLIKNQENNNENSQLNKTMLNSPINNNILNDNSNSIMLPKIEDPNDGNQKKVLDDFRDLLKKMDEKLENSSIQIKIFKLIIKYYFLNYLNKLK